MRRLPAALVALTAAATLALLASPASAAGGPRSFKTDADTVRAGQQIKVWGKGCRSQGYVRIYLDGRQITNDRADRAGVFVHYVEIPIATSPGEHSMKAGCNGYGLGSFKIVVRSSRFNVTPRSVKAGRSITVRGNLCKPGSYVTIKLGTELIGEDRANGKGNFIGAHRIPSDTPEGVYSVSARCHGKFVGSQLIEVKPDYPAQESLLTTDRTAVPAGQAVTISGTKCPTGKPSATLDGQRLNLAVNRSAGGKGFTATATIPATATPGKHTLSAECEAGSSGTTVLHVSEAAEPAAAKLVFGTQPPSDLALWAALFSGIAVLVASIGITTRRRRQP
jgi:hypothetical protein